MVSANVKWVQKVHCFVWWGCAWVRLVYYLELWSACMFAGPALFCEVSREMGPNRCISAYGEFECEMSAKCALFCIVGMCLSSTGTTLEIVGCVHICWFGTYLWRGREILAKSVYKCLWWVRMWNECKKCTILYGGDVPGFDWDRTWNCGVRAYMLVRHFFVKSVEKWTQIGV